AHLGGHILLLRAVPAVMKPFDARWHAQSPGARALARRETLAARAGVGPTAGQHAAGAGAAVNEIVRRQTLEIGLVQRQAARLPHGRFVPVHAETEQLLNDELIGAFG